LWTREEGRSDLELRLNARRTRTGYDVRLYDVLVP